MQGKKRNLNADEKLILGIKSLCNKGCKGFCFFFLIGKQRYIEALAKRRKKVHTEYTN